MIFKGPFSFVFKQSFLNKWLAEIFTFEAMQNNSIIRETFCNPNYNILQTFART